MRVCKTTAYGNLRNTELIMTTHYKRWTRLGLGAALAGTLALSACGGEAGEAAESGSEIAGPAGEAGEAGEGEGGEGEGGEIGHDMDTLPVEKRVAFMSGHVAAGLALYRAAAPDQAAKHLLHPVSETHAAERAGIDALGFEGSDFVKVSEALDAGKPASEVEPLLAKADANMSLVRANAGGDPKEIIAFLMDTVVEEYMVGVTDGVMADPGEYQDAYGFSVVALDIAMKIESEAARNVATELVALVSLWDAEGPLASSTPAPVSAVVAQTSKVQLALSDL
jgi:hypothetical protein